MDFKKHFERAWQVMMEHFAPVLINTLVMLVISVVSFGFLAPVVSAGYMQSLLLAVRKNRRPDVKDLFARMDLFFPLLGFTVLFAALVLLGMILLVLPGIAVLLAGTFFFVYLLPLMTDQNFGLIDALKVSSRMALEQPVSEHLAVVLVLLVLDSVGGSIGVGVLLAHPYACLFILSVYEEKRRRRLTGPGTNLSSAPRG